MATSPEWKWITAAACWIAVLAVLTAAARIIGWPSAPSPLAVVPEFKVPEIRFPKGSKIATFDHEKFEQLAKDLQGHSEWLVVVVGRAMREGDPDANRELMAGREAYAKAELEKLGVACEFAISNRSAPSGPEGTVTFEFKRLPENRTNKRSN